MEPLDIDGKGLRYQHGPLRGQLRMYTTLGCYPLFYLTADNGVLCAKCASSDGQTTDPSAEDWFLVAVDIHWEGEPLICDHCNAEIESAYGEPEESRHHAGLCTGCGRIDDECSCDEVELGPEK